MLQAGSNEDASVDLRSIHSAALAVMATALFLGGCSADDASGWFSKPVDLFGRRGGYSFSQLGGAKQERPVTANDLVDASGACATAPAPEAQAAVANPGQSAPGAPDEAAQLRGGVAVGMSECDVIARVGRPAAVNINAAAANARNSKVAGHRVVHRDLACVAAAALMLARAFATAATARSARASSVDRRRDKALRHDCA